MSYSFLNFKSIQGVKLFARPLTVNDLEEAGKVFVSPTTWFSVTRMINSIDEFKKYFTPLLEKQSRGETLTLLFFEKETRTMVAMSTFQHASPGFRKVEIGFTWVADHWQRTFVNTEMKLLMLTHAFEDMKTNRVEFSVHPSNEKSNIAMRRIGAKLEGTLRKWRYLVGTDDGNRNMYSIIDDEWPLVKKNLIQKLTSTEE